MLRNCRPAGPDCPQHCFLIASCWLLLSNRPVTNDITAQLAAIQREMASRPPGLVEHVRQTAAEAVALGHYFDIDPERIELAAWSHDLFRHLTGPGLLTMAREVGIAVSADDEVSPVVLHGPIAAAVIRDRFGVTDDEVVEAVASHTLGLAEMTFLAKVILLADKFEPGKRHRSANLRRIRRLARRDLDTALLCWSDWSWVKARESGMAIHGGSWHSRSRWVREHHAELNMPGRVADDVFELSISLR